MDKTGFQEVLKALQLHSAHIENKINDVKEQLEKRFEQMDERFDQMDERFDQMDERLNRLEIKFDAHRIDLTETQETVDYLTSKSAQHEKKLRQLVSQK